MSLPAQISRAFAQCKPYAVISFTDRAGRKGDLVLREAVPCQVFRALHEGWLTGTVRKERARILNR